MLVLSTPTWPLTLTVPKVVQKTLPNERLRLLSPVMRRYLQTNGVKKPEQHLRLTHRLFIDRWKQTGIGLHGKGSSRLGDLWGQRAVYLAGLAIFCIASFACDLAPTMTALIVFRVVQGIGAAIMTPGPLAITVRAFPPSQHGLAIGIYGGISALGTIAGPVLGGLLVHGESWRWIFLINVPNWDSFRHCCAESSVSLSHQYNNFALPVSKSNSR
jgi:hypothetical protein